MKSVTFKEESERTEVGYMGLRGDKVGQIKFAGTLEANVIEKRGDKSPPQYPKFRVRGEIRNRPRCGKNTYGGTSAPWRMDL